MRSSVSGVPFNGSASTAGVFYTGDDFPAAYKNTYFHADYGAQWIRNLQMDAMRIKQIDKVGSGRVTGGKGRRRGAPGRRSSAP